MGRKKKIDPPARTKQFTMRVTDETYEMLKRDHKHAIPEKGERLQKSGPEASGHPQTRNSKEVEAESVAYTVCRHFGLDTSDYSFAYIAGWSAGKETPELKASLQTIRTAASEMIEEIEGHMKELQKEHSTEVIKEDTDLTKEEKAGRLAAELDQFAMDVDPYGYADSVDDREAAVADLKEQLMKADNSVLGIKDYLQEMIEEGGEEASQAQELLTKLLDLVPELQSMEIQRALADTRPEATITFYAAECMEFPNILILFLTKGIDTASNTCTCSNCCQDAPEHDVGIITGLRTVDGYSCPRCCRSIFFRGFGWCFRLL